MHEEPSREHQWLEQLVGEWEGESECLMGPDQPPVTGKMTESVRMLGAMWSLHEGEGESPDGQSMKSIITLGFDPRQGRFVGTFIASGMTHLWLYNGSLDASGKVLTLDAEGPSFTGEGMSKYQDIVEIIDADHRTLKSQLLGEDGQWVQFMTAHYRRKA